MAVECTSIASVRQMYINRDCEPLGVLERAADHANSNARQNVYLSIDKDWSRNEVRSLRDEDIEKQPLWGIPVSLKDCFDLAGFPTSCGSSFYHEHHGIAAVDSNVAAKLRAAGTVITGKTHLHQLAYGITGENRDYGDCLQPVNGAYLTGGSSSGAAASVQEGSALAAIGTDTGGSIRAPAALCGVVGYRSSITLNSEHLWRGGYHLASTFDTIGWLYGSLADGPLLGHALLDLPIKTFEHSGHLRIGLPDAAFTEDCDSDILAALQLWRTRFETLEAGFRGFGCGSWSEAISIYAPIQASEAAAFHAGYFEHFEPAIAERLTWGASISTGELLRLRQRLAAFRSSTYGLFEEFDYLLVPCAPMSSIAAGADHTETRARILRYTTPVSLAGLPVVALPTVGPDGPAGGIQLVGRLGGDADLLALSAYLSEKFENNATLHS